jgi:hypothetical protein
MRRTGSPVRAWYRPGVSFVRACASPAKSDARDGFRTSAAGRVDAGNPDRSNDVQPSRRTTTPFSSRIEPM